MVTRHHVNASPLPAQEYQAIWSRPKYCARHSIEGLLISTKCGEHYDRIHATGSLGAHHAFTKHSPTPKTAIEKAGQGLKSAASAAKSQKAQHVAVKQNRKQVVLWMHEKFEKHERSKLTNETVRSFPADFCSSGKTSFQQASYWWAKRAETMKAEAANLISVHSRQMGIAHRLNTKAAPGSGPKRARRVKFIHFGLLENLKCLKETRVQLDTRRFLTLMKNISQESDENFNSG